MLTKSNTTFILVLAALDLFLMTACGQQSASNNPTGSARLEWLNQAIPLDTSGSGGGSVSTTSVSGSVSTFSGSLIPTLTLTGTLAPPVVGGTTVQADDITMNGTKVYLAYNVAGDQQSGGVDVIDVTLPTTPVLTSEQTYTDTDIHKVYVSGGYLYTAGATSSGAYPGAVIKKTLLTLTGDLTTTQTSTPLMATDVITNAAYAAVSVTSVGSNLYALAGTNGGLYKLNTSDLSLVSTTTLADARDVGYANGSLYVVTGQTAGASAGIQAYTTAGVASGAAVAIPNAQITQSKSTVTAGSYLNMASAGYGGVRIVCSATGALISTLTAPSVAGLAASKQTSNAVTYGNGLVFVANGEAGVYVYTLERALLTTGCTGLTVNYRGSFTFGTGISANNVYYAGGNLYVATGLGGFKIITVVQSLLTGLVAGI